MEFSLVSRPDRIKVEVRLFLISPKIVYSLPHSTYLDRIKSI